MRQTCVSCPGPHQTVSEAVGSARCVPPDFSIATGDSVVMPLTSHELIGEQSPRRECKSTSSASFTFSTKPRTSAALFFAILFVQQKENNLPHSQFSLAVQDDLAPAEVLTTQALFWFGPGTPLLAPLYVYSRSLYVINTEHDSC